MSVNFTTLFTRLGKGFALAETLLANASSDAPTGLEAFLDELSGMDETDQVAIGTGVDTALATYQSAAGSAITGLVQTPAQRLLTTMIDDDTPLPNTSLSTVLDELIRQMRVYGETVDASTPSVVISYGEGDTSSSGPPAGNAGNGTFVTSVYRGDGKVNEFILAEEIAAEVTSTNDAAGSSVWKLVGQAPAASALAWNWPLGSGLSKSLTMDVASGSNNKLANGDFEDEDDNATDLPDGWLAAVATLGTTLKLTDVEEQTITINGTPTGGYYVLRWTDQYGRTYWTAPLAYDAASGDVQTALQALPGLSEVTVESTGTSPNYTHTVTLLGVPNPAAFTSQNALTGGSTPTITHATLTAGSAYVMRGARAVEFDSNGSQLTSLMCPVALDAQKQYAVCVWMACDVAPAAGAFVVDLVDGVAGTVIADDEGVNNTFTIDATGLAGSFNDYTGVFRTPVDLPATVYLRIRISTPVSSGTSVFLDEASLVEMTELYTGGLYVAAFAGSVDQEVGDDVQLTVSNDRAGEIHEWLDRLFNLRTSRKLLPSDNAGLETIDDALIV